MTKLLIVFSLLMPLMAKSQCLNTVSIQNGTEIVNGISVTVSSSGITYYGSNCPNSWPYMIGNNGTLVASGEYIFEFSPSVETLTLNIVAIDNVDNNNYEEVELMVNGVHYNVTSLGTINYCLGTSFTTFPIITPNGNIGDLPGPDHGNCKDLTIPGPISSLRIIDHVVGNPAGINFSLRFCNSNLGLSDENIMSAQLIPNPFSNQATLYSSVLLNDATISVIDLQGKEILKKENYFGKEITIDRGELSAGIYILQIRQPDGLSINTKMIIDN